MAKLKRDVWDEARNAIRSASGLVILTGAGVSAESGVPTFRDPGGIWARFDPAELATPEAFRSDPARVWAWYGLRRRVMRTCVPNAGHLAIARLMAERQDVTLVTQNVDGLHQRALEGTGETRPTGRILELHGNLVRTRCSGCGVPAPEDGSSKDDADSAPGKAPTDEEVLAEMARTDLSPPPGCGICGAPLRPDVVWFGEMLPRDALQAAFDSAAAAEVCIVVGTSAVVYPAASVPFATLQSGGIVIEVNPQETPLTRLSRWSLRGPSGEVLPEILGG